MWVYYNNNNELYHHGVKGMKWGKRKARTQTSEADGNADNAAAQTRKSRAKKAAIIGAAVVGTAVAAYGAYKLSDYAKGKAYEVNKARGLDAVNKYMKHFDRENLTGLTDPKRRAHAQSYSDSVNKRLTDDALDYARRHSSTTSAALKTLLGKNREFTLAELRNMGISTAW